MMRCCGARDGAPGAVARHQRGAASLVVAAYQAAGALASRGVKATCGGASTASSMSVRKSKPSSRPPAPACIPGCQNAISVVHAAATGSVTVTGVSAVNSMMSTK